MAGGDVVGFEGVAGVELWQEFVFAAAIDTQESVKGDDFALGFENKRRSFDANRHRRLL